MIEQSLRCGCYLEIFFEASQYHLPRSANMKLHIQAKIDDLNVRDGVLKIWVFMCYFSHVIVNNHIFNKKFKKHH